MSSASLSQVVVIIDGLNVVHSSSWPHRDYAWDRSMSVLVDEAVQWALLASCRVIIVFDGQPKEQVSSVHESVEVLFSGKHQADQIIEARARELADQGREFDIVSSDLVVRDVAGACARKVLTAEQFIVLLFLRDEVLALPVDSGIHRGVSLGDAVSPETKAQLERLRRGE